MKYEITQEQLQNILNLIGGLANTNLFTPTKYSQEIVPFINNLQNLPIIEEDEKMECNENEEKENQPGEPDQGV